MGNGLSVSSIVDHLHALQRDERSEALDNLCEQHEEIRTYLKSKCHWDLEPPQQGQPKPRQPRLQPIHIKELVPDEERLSDGEYSSWSRDISLFWTSSYCILPGETCGEPLSFIYRATIQVEVEGHQDCLRRRYLALFWFDYFKARYPEQGTGFDYEYVELGRHILGSAVADTDEAVSKLRDQVKAGRKYSMLTAKFGDGILLTLPSSIGRSTLERKLPLDQEIFDTWIEPIVGSVWGETAKTEGIRDLGQRIRQSLLERCPVYTNPLARSSKKRKTNDTRPAVQETTPTIPLIIAESPASSITPSALTQVHSIHGCEGYNTGQINRWNISQSIHSSTSTANGVTPETFIPSLFYAMGSRVSHSPSPPQALLVSEELFHNIQIYFKDTCQNMILDDHGTLLTPDGAKLHNDLCNDFDSYYFTATMLKEKGLHVEFGRALSRAFGLIEPILRVEHPRTLACFLEVFIHLIQTGLLDVTSSLRGFIKEMSAKVTRKGRPWGQICRLLGELDSESLGEAMAQIWKCTTNTFDSELGTFSRLAVSVRLDYIKRVYGITNCPEEERLLQDLIAQFERIPSPPPQRVILNLAHNLNRQGRHGEAEGMAQKVRLLLQKHEIVERIELLKIISRSQFNQKKTLAAEQTMRTAIQTIMHQWGRQHSWVLEFMNVLEGWLRGWGREEEANKLRGEIEELIAEG